MGVWLLRFAVNPYYMKNFESILISESGKVDWRVFADAQKKAWNGSLSLYREALGILLEKGKLIYDNGYNAFAEDVINISPKEFARIGKRLCFTNPDDLFEYGKESFPEFKVYLELMKNGNRGC
jgi:hypothetical protein